MEAKDWRLISRAGMVCTVGAANLAAGLLTLTLPKEGKLRHGSGDGPSKGTKRTGIQHRGTLVSSRPLIGRIFTLEQRTHTYIHTLPYLLAHIHVVQIFTSIYRLSFQKLCPVSCVLYPISNCLHPRRLTNSVPSHLSHRIFDISA